MRTCSMLIFRELTDPNQKVTFESMILIDFLFPKVGYDSSHEGNSMTIFSLENHSRMMMYFFQNPRDLDVWKPPRKDLIWNVSGGWIGGMRCIYLYIYIYIWHIYFYIYTAIGWLKNPVRQGLDHWILGNFMIELVSGGLQTFLKASKWKKNECQSYN